MKHSLFRSKEGLTGLMFLGVALFVIIQSSSYSYGSLEAMGPALFPTLLAALLMLIGAMTLVRAVVKSSDPVERIAIRPLALISIAIFVTGWTLTHLGIVLALPILIAIAAFGTSDTQWDVKFLAFVVALTAITVLTFVVFLKLPIPLFGTVFG